jgi:hypothetical protein
MKLDNEQQKVIDMFEKWADADWARNELKLLLDYGQNRERSKQLVAYYAGYLAAKKETKSETTGVSHLSK